MPKRSRLVLTPDEYHALRIKVHKRDNWKCRCCKRRSNLHAHHIVFRSHGGDDADWNLITMCMVCHDALHDGCCVLIMQAGVIADGKTAVDANQPVVFQVLNGWVPGKPTGKSKERRRQREAQRKSEPDVLAELRQEYQANNKGVL